MPTEPTRLNLSFLGKPMGVLGYRPNGPSFALDLSKEFLESGHELSPVMFLLRDFAAGPRFFQSNDSPFVGGLPGFLADSLPDAWGARMLRLSHPEIQTPLGKLAAIGERGPGGISFAPALDAATSDSPASQNLVALAARANDLRTDPQPLTSDRIKAILARASSSLGGAFPKTNAHLRLDSDIIDRREILVGGVTPPGYTPCILKFDRSDDEAEGAVEFAFSQMARNAGIRVARTALISDGQTRHFATERFDRYLRPDNSIGRRHVHTLSGMLHKRASDGEIDYEELMRLSRVLGGATEATECFRRTVFNLLAANRDDHGRNHAFLYDENKRSWTLSPAYDLNPSVANRLIALTFFRSDEIPPTFAALNRLAEVGGIPPQKAREVYDQVEGAVIGGWREVATRSSVPETMIRYWGKEIETQTRALRDDASQSVLKRRPSLTRELPATPDAKPSLSKVAGVAGARDANPGSSRTPAMVAIVAELNALRKEWGEADNATRASLSDKAAAIVNATTGSGLTKIPLRIAARDFVEGKAGLEQLNQRLIEHVGARTAGQVLRKARGSGLER